MKKSILGATGIEVSRICFGTLTMGPLQRKLSYEEGGALIRYALENGINFFDTAQLYQTYEYLREGLKGKRKEAVISTKTYAYTAELAKQSLDEALNKLGTDYIDLFLLHEQESAYTIKGHWEAVEYFLRAKEEGLIRGFGLSTHSVEGVKAALKLPEIEVVHPIINFAGLGILDGNREEMLDAIRGLKAAGRGVFGMKLLGGGNLIRDYDEAMNFARDLDCVDSIALGMQSIDEIDGNIQYFMNGEIEKDTLGRLNRVNRSLLIEDHCNGCGKCIERCGYGAIHMEGARATVKHERCVTCGYCAGVCPDFCIKVV